MGTDLTKFIIFKMFQINLNLFLFFLIFLYKLELRFDRANNH